MLRRKCEICGLKSKREKGIKRFFMAQFPLDEDRCKEWVKVTGNEDLAYIPIEKLHELKFVCGEHFQNKDFNTKKSRLKRTAVPTIRLTANPLSDDILKEFPFTLLKGDCAKNEDPSTSMAHTASLDFTSVSLDATAGLDNVDVLPNVQMQNIENVTLSPNNAVHNSHNMQKTSISAQKTDEADQNKKIPDIMESKPSTCTYSMDFIKITESERKYIRGIKRPKTVVQTSQQLTKPTSKTPTPEEVSQPLISTCPSDLRVVQSERKYIRGLRNTNAVEQEQDKENVLLSPDNMVQKRQQNSATNFTRNIVEEETGVVFSWQKEGEDLDVDLDRPDPVPSITLTGDDDREMFPNEKGWSWRDGGRKPGAFNYNDGYRCDVCSANIGKFRYVCVECPNLDLCAACEFNNEDAQHYVLRVPANKPPSSVEAALRTIRRALLMDAIVHVPGNTLLEMDEVKEEIEDPIGPDHPEPELAENDYENDSQMITDMTENNPSVTGFDSSVFEIVHNSFKQIDETNKNMGSFNITLKQTESNAYEIAVDNHENVSKSDSVQDQPKAMPGRQIMTKLTQNEKACVISLPTRVLSAGLQPSRPRQQPSPPGLQPSPPGLQPSRPRQQPSPPGLQPSRPRQQPSPPGLQPSPPGLQPSPPGLQPSRPGLRTRTPGKPRTIWHGHTLHTITPLTPAVVLHRLTSEELQTRHDHFVTKETQNIPEFQNI